MPEETPIETAAIDQSHVCTCGDCERESFVDLCKFEVALRELIMYADSPNHLYHQARIRSLANARRLVS